MWEIDSLVEFMEENYSNALGICIKALFGEEVTEEHREKWDAYFDKMVPFLTGRLAKHEPGKYIAGTDSLTIADLKVY